MSLEPEKQWVVVENDDEVFRGTRAMCQQWIETHGALRLHSLITAESWDFVVKADRIANPRPRRS